MCIRERYQKTTHYKVFYQTINLKLQTWKVIRNILYECHIKIYNIVVTLNMNMTIKKEIFLKMFKKCCITIGLNKHNNFLVLFVFILNYAFGRPWRMACPYDCVFCRLTFCIPALFNCIFNFSQYIPKLSECPFLIINLYYWLVHCIMIIVWKRDIFWK